MSRKPESPAPSGRAVVPLAEKSSQVQSVDHTVVVDIGEWLAGGAKDRDACVRSVGDDEVNACIADDVGRDDATKLRAQREAREVGETDPAVVAPESRIAVVGIGVRDRGKVGATILVEVDRCRVVHLARELLERAGGNPLGCGRWGWNPRMASLSVPQEFGGILRNARLSEKVEQRVAGSRMPKMSSCGDRPALSAILATLVAVAGCVSGSRDASFATTALQVSDGFYSGRAPEGASDFDSLVAHGITTIVAVDGPCPDAASAVARGVRTIHLPITYHGIPHARRVELIRAVMDARARGGVYLHCHHGRHRGPCAAAVAAIGLGWITPDHGIALLAEAGTSSAYGGLFEAVRTTKRVSASDLESVGSEFPECEMPSDIVSAMSELDIALDQLARVDGSSGASPAALAGGISEVLRRLADTDDAQEYGAGFLAMLWACDARARALEDVLREPTVEGARRDDALTALQSSCRECHARHRD